MADTEDPTDAKVLLSSHRLLGVSEIKEFKSGRPLSEIMESIQYRGNFEMATKHNGKAIVAISYELLPEQQITSTLHNGEVLWAIFIEGRFEKFVRWPKWAMESYDYQGTPASRAMSIEVGDYSRLVQAAESEPVSLQDAMISAEAIATSRQQINPGLTIAWLRLRELGGPETVPASEADYKLNAELRNQFNAARLTLGMKQDEVESVLQSKPLGSSKTMPGTLCIYGRRKSFNIDHTIHYSNIIVIFNDGLLSGIYAGESAPGGKRGLEEMTDWFQSLEIVVDSQAP